MFLPERYILRRFPLTIELAEVTVLIRTARLDTPVSCQKGIERNEDPLPESELRLFAHIELDVRLDSRRNAGPWML
jgi:hypothetical protein